jgi:hypothetical protein
MDFLPFIQNLRRIEFRKNDAEMICKNLSNGFEKQQDQEEKMRIKYSPLP